MQCWKTSKTLDRRCIDSSNVLCLLSRRTFSQTLYIYSMLAQCWDSVEDVGLALKQHWINVSFKTKIKKLFPVTRQTIIFGVDPSFFFKICQPLLFLSINNRANFFCFSILIGAQYKKRYCLCRICLFCFVAQK